MGPGLACSGSIEMRRFTGDMDVEVSIPETVPSKRSVPGGVADEAAAESCAPLAMVKWYVNARNSQFVLLAITMIRGEV